MLMKWKEKMGIKVQASVDQEFPRYEEIPRSSIRRVSLAVESQHIEPGREHGFWYYCSYICKKLWDEKTNL